MAAVRRPHWRADPCPNWQRHRCIPPIEGPCGPGPQQTVEGCTSVLERQHILPWRTSCPNRVQCIPEATIQERGHRIRHLDRRHWSVGSNRIKHLVVDSEAWRQEGHCKLCLVSMDSYDHIYRECPHPDIADTRGRLLEGIRRQNSTLTGNEALLAATLLQLYQVEDGYRIALGDLTTSHRLRLFPIYQYLPHSTVREADALFLRLVRQLNHLRAGIWAEREHILDPAVRPWAEDVPKGSKWYVVYRGHSPGHVYTVPRV